jgi:hypothetical protein
MKCLEQQVLFYTENKKYMLPEGKLNEIGVSLETSSRKSLA